MIEEIKVSQLPEASQINDDDLIMIVQSGTNKKITKENCQFASGDEIAISTTEPSDEEKLWVDPTNAYVGVDESDKDYYSTSEIKTNKVWVDNKPIYRKVIFVEELPNNTGITVLTGISSVDKMIKMVGMAYNKTSFLNAFPLPYVDKYSGSNNNIEITWLGTNKEIRINTSNDRTGLCAYITLEYTK